MTGVHEKPRLDFVQVHNLAYIPTLGISMGFGLVGRCVWHGTLPVVTPLLETLTKLLATTLDAASGLYL
jgi:hypothetical protein